MSVVPETNWREAKDRYAGGEVTQDRRLQVEAQLAAARAGAFKAQSTLQSSIADYRKVLARAATPLEARAAEVPIFRTSARGDGDLTG